MDEEKVECLLWDLNTKLIKLDFNGKRLLLWFLKVFYKHILLRGY